jgi:hypothetical protein
MPFVVEKLRTKWVLANSWMTTSSSFKISVYKSFEKSLGALTTKHLSVEVEITRSAKAVFAKIWVV